ncbi:methyltransferase domain-containing protein [Roseomonas sp. NAR14]|uniref:Methyltransferase domain-containing protein n=1 Tax=Roseomonas acroporae TaxID=2937791 RepID=A0A9X2BW39_9PROT|nr:methyltransferase domain-containing protein [Roseomonas acroporae]MCK8785636.1 methyltransferase domain-containing protein [Roseomonas acroporae]
MPPAPGPTPDPAQVFDRALHRRRRDRAAGTVHRVAPILEDAADRLLDRLDDTTRRFSRALDLGGRGVVAPLLRGRGIPFVVSADLSPRMAALPGAAGPDAPGRASGLPVAADEEFLPFAPGSFDLIVANLSLHWVNDLPGALLQLRRALAPDGLFLASLPGLGTLQPLRAALTEAEAALTGGAAPRVSPFPELRDGAALLQRAGFALPVADADQVTLRYRDPFALFADLRAAGETNAVRARDPRTPPRALFPLAASRLPAGPGDASEGVAIPLRLLVLTGWAPHESQSRPARPGSADVRLADALGAEEKRLPR